MNISHFLHTVTLFAPLQSASRRASTSVSRTTMFLFLSFISLPFRNFGKNESGPAQHLSITNMGSIQNEKQGQLYKEVAFRRTHCANMHDTYSLAVQSVGIYLEGEQPTVEEQGQEKKRISVSS
mmetsp:Transcript_31841/g.83120  ORF Transcript_31841/g.83120 Transcript_31841/m.83120 type:complete len:124 (-) Transcript_31841:885-1256(-)